MQITLIRHLPTDWNKKQKLQGRRDIGISPITRSIQKEIVLNQQLLKTHSPFDIRIGKYIKTNSSNSTALWL